MVCCRRSIISDKQPASYDCVLAGLEVITLVIHHHGITVRLATAPTGPIIPVVPI